MRHPLCRGSTVGPMVGCESRRSSELTASPLLADGRLTLICGESAAINRTEAAGSEGLFLV